MRFFALLFIVIPLTELYLLLWVSRRIGFVETLLLTVVTGMVGASLAKREGLKVWRDYQAALSELRPPDTGVIDGLLVLLGGALLITPGVLTDVLGLLLLLPWSRTRLAAQLRRRINERLEIAVHTRHGQRAGPMSGSEQRRKGPRQVMDPGPAIDPGQVIDTVGESRDQN